MSDDTSNTGEKLANNGRFVKGDKRINRNGRPKSFDKLRKLAQQISHEPIADDASMTAIEAILRQMAHDNPARFVEIAFGKVPDQSENYNINLDDLSDEQLEKLANGGSIRSILATPGRRKVETQAAPTSTDANTVAE
jgi:hypothetical protein